MSEERDTIEDVVEPYLIQKGYIKRTPRGRMGPAKAFNHMVSERPDDMSDVMPPGSDDKGNVQISMTEFMKAESDRD